MNEIEKPCILIYSNNANGLILKEILAGIEEEGIPYLIKNSEDKDLIEITYQYAQISKIGIALGISNNRVVVHFHKLNLLNPIIDVELKLFEKEKARVIGNNAARLYKVMPFKSFEENLNMDYLEYIKEQVLKELEKRLSEGGIK
ncbi:propanediol dehydratase [Caloramator sp. E03]|uniref:glycerol dehydratase reactivase beta/small subunit family protein n=1 Tax=Caloramator sp. E03 TaxID=2576307 RepID=UPI00111093C0|nr:glycerol dehydratase reactivase beta/small subunit family protein [Caloramator sp. E03]QCX34511.1 propanediol dehydratase [Caloramator sp. E03]